jgi:hypothetical protein
LGEECVQVIFFDQLVAFVLLLDSVPEHERIGGSCSLSSQCFSLSTSRAGIIFLVAKNLYRRDSDFYSITSIGTIVIFLGTSYTFFQLPCR